MAKNVQESMSLSSGQMEALTALCDAFVPSTDSSLPDYAADNEWIVRFYRMSASMAGTPPRLALMLTEKIKHPRTYLCILALRLLSTWPGTFILCGRKSLSTKFPYFQRFSKVSSKKREEIMVSWSDSYFFLLRILYAGLKIFTLLIFFTQVNESNVNVSWKAIGYTGPDTGHEMVIKPPIIQAPQDHNSNKEEMTEPLNKGIINLNQPRDIALEKLHNLGFSVTKQNPKNTSFVIKCDAVVLGSGAGGAVVAGVLAKAGHKVVVLEKGSYYAKTDLSLLEGEAMERMYLENGLLGTKNMDVIMLAGATVGGGTTINWSASIRTPKHVRREWSGRYKLELFDTERYDTALDVVCQRMGVQSDLHDEGFSNMILRKGCESLGYPVETVPRNAPPDHYCGWCHLGCKDGRKNGVLETWLVDLVDSGNGAIIPECEAIKVITEKTKDRKKANGVVFAFQYQGHREIAIVESKVTIVACGAISTPSVLKQTGLKNPNLGKNLHLHPVAMAWGYFPEKLPWPEAEKKSYKGGIITAMSKYDDCSVIIQTPALHPGMFSALMPWRSGTDIKNRMLKFSRTTHLFALTRDKGSGVVTSPTNISYELAVSEQENLSKGLERVLRILASAGAEEIGTHHRNGRVLKVKESTLEEFERFVKEESLRSLKDQLTPICSAHQMGSCRMGVDRKGSAVGPNGETWEVEGLFVADSSVFPTALGVNPMVTVQAIAYCTAQSVLEVLGKDKC